MCNTEYPKVDWGKPLIWHGNKAYSVEYLGPTYDNNNLPDYHIVKIYCVHPQGSTQYVIVNERGQCLNSTSEFMRVSNKEPKNYSGLWWDGSRWGVARHGELMTEKEAINWQRAGTPNQKRQICVVPT